MRISISLFCIVGGIWTQVANTLSPRIIRKQFKMVYIYFLGPVLLKRGE